MCRYERFLLKCHLSEEVHEFFGRERRGACSVKDVFGQGALFAVELVDALFHRIGGDQVVDCHRVMLTDAVGSVSRLAFNGGVPPRIQEDHVVCRREVETDRIRKIRWFRLDGLFKTSSGGRSGGRASWALRSNGRKITMIGCVCRQKLLI